MPRSSLPIRKLPNGKHQARPAGFTPQTFDTFKEARVWCLARLAEREAGKPGVNSVPTFREYAEKWVWDIYPGVGESKDRIASSLNHHLYPIIGDTPLDLDHLSPNVLQGAITNLRKLNGDPMATNTARVVLQHLNQVLNAARKNGDLLRNPAKGVKVAPGENAEIVPATAEEIHALAEAIDPRSRGLIAAGASLGLRQGEAFGVVRPALKFLLKSAHVGTKVRYGKDANGDWNLYLDKYTKTRNRQAARPHDGHRDVPMSEAAINELNRHLEEFGVGPHQLLFWDREANDMLYHRNWNREVWWPAAQAIGMNKTFHSLRHFYATSLLRKKVSVAAVAKMLGDHQATVIRYYSHFIEDDLEVIRAAIDDALKIGSDHLTDWDRLGPTSAE